MKKHEQAINLALHRTLGLTRYAAHQRYVIRKVRWTPKRGWAFFTSEGPESIANTWHTASGLTMAQIAGDAGCYPIADCLNSAQPCTHSL
jgi:hypothetical protein